MSTKYSILNFLLVCFLSISCATLEAQDGASSRDVRVMSFNIRYGTADDGENHWEKRKAFLVDTIKEFNPDLLGTQETLGFQRDYLASQLPEYDTLGVGRDDGKEAGEMMALYYHKDRFEKIDGGHFWLSESPEQPGTKSWDSSLPRMVTWVLLRERNLQGAPSIAFFNTHFDHRGAEARLESARLIRKRISQREEYPIIVTGDFNTGEGTDPYQALFGDVDNQPSPIVDTYRLVHPVRAQNEGTFSGFRVSATDGERIDWIGASRHWEILEAGIDHSERDGSTPSDHFAVTAILRLQK